MPDIDGWRVHSEGDEHDVVLAVDFPISGRHEAGFGDFAAQLPGLTLWETLPDTATRGQVSGQAQLDRWLPPVQADGRTVRAIATYCAGAAYAEALADGIGRWQDTPPELVLFDPETPVALTLSVQYRRVLTNFAPMLSPEQIAEFDAAADRIHAEADGDIETLQHAVSAELARVAETGFTRAGIDLKHGKPLLDTFDAFARYLVAGSQLKHDTAWPTATAITSNSSTNGLNLVDDSVRDQLVAREFRVDVEHRLLLSDPTVAELVQSIVVAGAAAV